MAVPSRIKQRIGKFTKPVLMDVEKGQIRRFALAIGEHSPIHSDEKAAKAAGYASVIAPPTFAAVLSDQTAVLEELELNSQTTMHAEEEYEYFRPIIAGDRINVSHRVVDAYDKQAPNGRLLFVVIETRGTDKRSRIVFKVRRVLVELKS